ncbi:MAG: hypothetical protein IJ438_12285 [Clostridia bacterium]|nr:hypothetical protein [Clostridia bacterium]
MGILDKLLRKNARNELAVTVALNARYQPIDRSAYVELTERFLKEKGWGRLGGGEGTMLSPEGVPVACDFDILISPDKLEDVTAALDKVFFVPKGSRLVIGDEERPIGQQEGLALHLNGTDLPREVYQNNDINATIEKLEAHLGEERGRFLSFWQHAQGAALYFYGPSYADMKAALEEVIPDLPLCEKSRIEQIA